MTPFRSRIMAQVLPFLLVAPGLALAQAPPSRVEATAAVNPAGNPGAAQYTRQQIDQMVAPIALYPDQLLTQVLMAATYPDQINDAAQWLQDPQHAGLKGEALVTALQPLPWDPSVKALVAFPQVIVMLSQHIEWTQALGVAFATQQPEVMVRVQALRHLAVRSGRLRKLHHLVVREEGTEIVIVPAEPDRVFVPVYNPVVVYGTWPDPGYQPVYLPPPPDFVAETIEPGLEVSVGYGIVAPLWGWSRPDWRDGRITVNETEYTRITQNVQNVENVRIGPGGTWQRSGPVRLVTPAAAPNEATRSAAMPAGTVAPAAAAGVKALPQRAAREPEKIQTGRTTTPGTAQPSHNEAATQPGTAATGQAATAPGTAEPGRTRAMTAKPGMPQTGQTEAAPSVTHPGRTQATTRPEVTRPGEAPSAASRMPSAHAPAGTAAETGTTRSETHAPATMHHNAARLGTPETAPSRAEARHPGTAAEEPGARYMTPPAAPALREHERAGTRTAPGTTTAPTPHSARTVEPPTTRHPSVGETGALQHQAPARMPEHAVTAPPSQSGAMPPPSHAMEHPAAPRESVGQGSSMPPHGATPHAPAASPTHQPGGPHAATGPEENKKNEH